VGSEHLLSVIGALLIAMGGYIARCLSQLTISVQELNIRIAVVVSRMDDHDKRITHLENKP
jgi:hypothetical protein